MSKTLLFGVAGLIIVGGLVYLLAGGQEQGVIDEGEQVQNNQSADRVEESMSGNGPLLAMMTLGKDIECDFSSEDESGSTTGVFRYTDGRYRVTADTTTADGVYRSNFYSDGEQNYVWSSGPQGEMAIVMDSEESEADEAANNFATNQAEEGFDVSADTTYECRDWSVVESQMVPPEDIDFMDMTQMMEEMMGSMPEGFEMPEGMPQAI